MQKGKEAPIASHSPKAQKIEGVGWRKESEHALLPSLCENPAQSLPRPLPTPLANTPANTPCQHPFLTPLLTPLANTPANTPATPPFVIEINKQEI